MADGSTKAEAFLRHLEPVKTRLERYCRRCLHDDNAVQDILQAVVAKTFAEARQHWDLYHDSEGDAES